ncbi:hypothetical protein H2200_013094 [Cladophialophora chaetospira]|uniref:Heterokaryon incompatibility domain-containing protein n=1 Tax=Cladophialophora chaetospira TaxID=386627 RepID=A0AA38WWR1_9EURO|nr:hypothetical protein H2200_013094 [Cladophialophora chaetospira]
MEAAPTTEGNNSQIHGTFQLIDLSSDILPHFGALSYVWGEPDGNVHTISCDGKDLEVFPNCHSALRHLRGKLASFATWIDAICIDPDNVHEKETQIQHMGDVYSKAHVVYVWLGAGNTRTSLAMADLANPPLLNYFVAGGSREDALP